MRVPTSHQLPSANDGICPDCGHENGAKFGAMACAECGHWIEAAARPTGTGSRGSVTQEKLVVVAVILAGLALGLAYLAQRYGF